MQRRFIIALLVLVFLASNAAPALAQDPNGAWGEVVNQDGSINYGNLTDGGVVTQPADWMPNIPFVGPVEAEYHVYYTESGNQVLMPTVSTLFFMAANAGESGFNAAASTMGTSGLSTAEGNNMFTGVAGLGTLWADLTGGPDSQITLPSGEQIFSSTFFSDVLSGQTDIYALGPDGLGQFLTSLVSQTAGDFLNGEGLNLYTYMLLYTPDGCGASPVGCSAEQLDLIASLATPMPTAIPAINCPAPVVRLGAITVNGEKTWPPYPLVVGQDPEETGVNVVLTASVAPTVYTMWIQEAVEECVPGPNGAGIYNCGGGSGHREQTGWECVAHSQSYDECIDFAAGHLTLSQSSRDWILNELSIRYPEAYLHKPNFSLTGSGCSWSASQDQVQIEDPGIWNLSVSGMTSGTPVSAPRSFGKDGEPFEVWLKEIAIIK